MVWSYNGQEKRKVMMFYFMVLGADEDYAKTFQLEVKEGRFFSSEFSTDKTAVVINEAGSKNNGV